MLGDQQFVRSIVVDYCDFEFVEFVDVFWYWVVFVCQDDDWEIQVGLGEVQVFLVFWGSYDVGQQVQLIVFGLFQDLCLGFWFDRCQVDVQVFLQQVDVVGGEFLVVVLFVVVFEWWLGGVYVQVDVWVFGQLGLCECEGVGQFWLVVGQIQEKYGLQMLYEVVLWWMGI